MRHPGKQVFRIQSGGFEILSFENAPTINIAYPEGGSFTVGSPGVTPGTFDPI
jgi:hypothetical protein